MFASNGKGVVRCMTCWLVPAQLLQSKDCIFLLGVGSRRGGFVLNDIGKHFKMLAVPDGQAAMHGGPVATKSQHTQEICDPPGRDERQLQLHREICCRGPHGPISTRPRL